MRADTPSAYSRTDSSQQYLQNDSEPGEILQLTPETHKAVEAVRFIAAHLKNEDDYAEVTHQAMQII